MILHYIFWSELADAVYVRIWCRLWPQYKKRTLVSMQLVLSNAYLCTYHADLDCLAQMLLDTKFRVYPAWQLLNILPTILPRRAYRHYIAYMDTEAFLTNVFFLRVRGWYT